MSVACLACREVSPCPFCDSCHTCDGLCAEAAAVEAETGDPDAGRWWS